MDTKISTHFNPRYIICAMIESGLIDLPKLIDWADTAIGRVANPSHWLFSVSLSSNLNDLNYFLRCSLADDNILEHCCIDSLFIGFVYMRYKDNEITCKDMDKILSEHFVFDNEFFNEDSLYTYFYEPNSNIQLVNEIDKRFVESEIVSRKAMQYFYSDEVLIDLQ